MVASARLRGHAKCWKKKPSVFKHFQKKWCCTYGVLAELRAGRIERPARAFGITQNVEKNLQWNAFWLPFLGGGDLAWVHRDRYRYRRLGRAEQGWASPTAGGGRDGPIPKWQVRTPQVQALFGEKCKTPLNVSTVMAEFVCWTQFSTSVPLAMVILPSRRIFFNKCIGNWRKMTRDRTCSPFEAPVVRPSYGVVRCRTEPPRQVFWAPRKSLKNRLSIL